MADVEDDPARLRETIHRLRIELRLNPAKKELGATRASLKRRVKLQHELEVAFHILAEVVETKRVEEVGRLAVESGLVDTAKYMVEHFECPICLEEKPKLRHPYSTETEDASVRRFYCCGALCCELCAIQDELSQIQVGIETEIRTGEARRCQCPFCRTLFPKAEAEAFN